jgi:hypothetical protein
MIEIDKRKKKLMDKIARFEDGRLIYQLERLIDEMNSSKMPEKDSVLFKPLKDNLNIDEMIAEQSFKKIDRVKFDELVYSIDIQEPLNELLLIK